MKSKPKLVIAGYFGSSNIGDETILSTEIGLLREDFDLAILSLDPSKTSYDYNVTSAKLPSLSKPEELLHFSFLIARCDAFILGGGGFFANKLQPFSIYYWFLLIAVAKTFRKKIIFFAMGVGPFRTGIHSALIRLVLNQVDLMLLRDKTSKHFLKDHIKVKAPTIVTGDMAFLLEDQCSLQNDLLVDSIKNSETPLALFVLCPRFQSGQFWKDPDQCKYKQYVMSMAELGDVFVDEFHGTPIFLPFYKADTLFYRDIIKNMKHRQDAVLLKHSKNLSALLTLFRKVDLVVGARYHSILFSIMAGTPVLPIVYQHKGYSIAKTIGVPYLEVGDGIEWANTNIDVAKAKKSMISICSNKQEYSNSIALKKRDLATGAMKNVIILKKMLLENKQ